MTLFWASVSIICAFFSGAFAAVRLTFRFCTKMFDKTAEQQANLHAPMAVSYTCIRVRERVEAGCTSKELIAFLDAEQERVNQVMGAAGREAGEALVHEWVKQRKEKP